MDTQAQALRLLGKDWRKPWIAAIAVCLLYFAASSSLAQKAEMSAIDSKDGVFQVHYPKSLLVCSHLDGENPDVWSPKECMAQIPVCDNAGHAGDVLMCLADPASEFGTTNLQAAAFAVSRLSNLNAQECVRKWARSNATNIHEEKIGALSLRAAKSEEATSSNLADQSAYRIFHRGACYELDVNLVIATDGAFAAEDAPRKLTTAEHAEIIESLNRALAGFKFLK